MKLINKKDFIKIIKGANLLGTGGGGTIEVAKKILKKIDLPVKLIDLSELKDKNIVCSVFGVGGKSNCNALFAINDSFSLFQKIINKKISGIISVEAGPESIATAIYVSNLTKIPIVNSDIVGQRCSPEVFLETISLKKYNRFPCVISDGKGNSSVLYKCENLRFMEDFFRNFSILSGGDAYVAGYALTKKDLIKTVPKNSISLCKESGKLLQEMKRKKINLEEFSKKTLWEIIGKGLIINEKREDAKGFCEGFYEIKTEKNLIKVIFKNENIVILKNNKVILTTPDSISLLDLNNFEAINNFNSNDGKNVAILGKKAIPIWRTKKAKELFSPKNLGLNYEQKLLD